MRSSSFALALLLLALAGCDLSEADRMDITRQKVVSLAPDVQGVKFFGRKQISIDTLVSLTPGLWPESVWALDLGADSASTNCQDWTIRGTWEGKTIFKTHAYLPACGATTSGWDSFPQAGEWMRHPDQLRLELEDSDGKTWTFSPTFLEDFNELHWDSTFAGTTPRTGDTLRLKVGVDRGSPGRSDSMPVFADYTGLRTVGNYVTYLKANDTATLSWVVTAIAGDTISLDLGWGTLGESQSFGFRVKR
jgi:hypothetical protein